MHGGRVPPQERPSCRKLPLGDRAYVRIGTCREVDVLLMSAGAFVLGAVLATCVPLGQLCAGLFTVTVVGFATALWAGTPVSTSLLWSVVLFAAAQVGYIGGVGLIAAFGLQRRGGPTAQSDGAGQAIPPQSDPSLRPQSGDR